MANHQTFICFFVPAIGIILLYRCFIEKKKSSSIILLVLVCGVSIAAFVYFQLLKHPLPFQTAEEAYHYLSKKAQFPIVKDMIEIEYYLDNIDNLTIYGSKNIGIRIVSQIFMIIFYSGFIAFFMMTWIKSIKRAQEKFMKFLYFLCLLSPAVTIIAYVFAVDWGRWDAQIFISQSAMLLFWLYHQREEVQTTVFDTIAFFKKNKVVFLIFFMVTCFIYFVNTGAFGSLSDTIRSVLPS
ncbi:hypothetical protein SDC9_156281 [bioreactor metagenome]|uniref:Uncharacterized protein n=1 Tax=bioreactor metagenome TaxID=1076179 RepID=A0A645F951_9ZZZZ